MLNRISMSLKRKFKRSPKTKRRISRPAKVRLLTHNVNEGSSAEAGLDADDQNLHSAELDPHDQADELNSPARSYETVPGGTDADPDEIESIGTRLTSIDATAEAVDDAGPHTPVPEIDQDAVSEEISAADLDEDLGETASVGTQLGGMDPATAVVDENSEAFSINDADQQSYDEDEAVDLSAVDEEAIREQYYINFTEEGDDEGDYTNGPPRMILTSDGVKSCVGLLVTLPLSNIIKSAVEAQRDYSKIQKKALHERGVYTRFGYALKAEISSRKVQLSEDDTDEVDRRRIESELSNLEMMLDTNQSERARIQSDVDYAAETLRERQADLSVELEAAWIRAQLLQPEGESAEEEMQELDVQAEYKKFLSECDRSAAGTPVTATLFNAHEGDAAEPETLSPEEQREADLKNTVWTAFWRYNNAYQAFENRADARQAEQLARDQAIEAGEATIDESAEAFDLRWLQKIQEMTRELIEAESDLSAAKAAAAEGGIDVPMDDQASGFVDDVGDGYRMSLEQAMISSAPVPKINDWMGDIPEVASPSFNEQTPDADDWEADEVGISDSASMVAFDAGDRKRIDKWRKVCGIE